MRTKNSVDLKHVREPCCGAGYAGGCMILVKVDPGCGTYKCPFYKPKGCEKWVRLEYGKNIELIPPEEWAAYWRRYYEQADIRREEALCR